MRERVGDSLCVVVTEESSNVRLPVVLGSHPLAAPPPVGRLCLWAFAGGAARNADAARARLDAARYRDSGSLDYRTASGGDWSTGGTQENFTYDDASNRTAANQQDPFGNTGTDFADEYTTNAANEYTQI